jgi:hypothetical protein
MFESLQALVPAEWRGAFAFLTAPLAWIPDWHVAMINFAWYGDTLGEVLFKRTVVLLPMMLVVVGVWATMASLYTLPFRSRRGQFLTVLSISWWDALRTVWLYWAGMVRFFAVLLGWIWELLRLGVRLLVTAIKGTFRSPLTFLDWTSRSYFKPGVPWVAFLALLLWCTVEATIFMYTLSPTLTEVLAGITGFEPDPRVMGPILWIFLYLLILGSFACIQVLGEAIRNRRITEIVQMSFVELSVMFFEVIFLYRELIDAITPWIAQQTGESVRLGLASTLALASFGWVGVRGMTWFLFGRFGTPAVLSILARDTIKQGEPVVEAPQAVQPAVWKEAIAALKAEADYFKKEARYAFELLTLPVLQLLAAAVNAVVVVIMSRPMFVLPFKNLNQALAATPRWTRAPEGAGDADAGTELDNATGLATGGVK